MIHAFAGFNDAGNTTQAAVQRLLEVPKADSPPSKRASEVNEPSKPQLPKEATPRKGRRTVDYDMQ